MQLADKFHIDDVLKSPLNHDNCVIRFQLQEPRGPVISTSLVLPVPLKNIVEVVEKTELEVRASESNIPKH